MKLFTNRYRPDIRVLGTVLVVKALFFLLAWQAYQVVSNRPVGGVPAFLGHLSNWDAESFLWIAQNGYTADGPKRFLLVFLPFYPMLTSSVGLIFRDYILSAFIVSTIASIAAALLLRRLVRLDHPERIAQVAVLFLFIFPTSLFLHVPYTESLFLALVIGSFFAARTERWLIGGMLGFFACLTRVNGVVLLPALALEAWDQYKARREADRRWGWILLAPAGFMTYLFVNYYVTGNALKFLDYQRENWYKYMRFPYEGIKEKVYTFLEQPPEAGNMYGLQELIFIALGLAFIIFGWKHMRNSYRVWMVLNWLLFISTSFILSVPRYTLTLFPIFILIAAAVKRRPVLNVAFTAWSLLFLGFFTIRYVNGAWAF
jgi:Mannosyltransferase (PIG-V)